MFKDIIDKVYMHFINVFGDSASKKLDGFGKGTIEDLLYETISSVIDTNHASILQSVPDQYKENVEKEYYYFLICYVVTVLYDKLKRVSSISMEHNKDIMDKIKKSYQEVKHSVEAYKTYSFDWKRIQKNLLDDYEQTV